MDPIGFVLDRSGVVRLGVIRVVGWLCSVDLYGRLVCRFGDEFEI